MQLMIDTEDSGPHALITAAAFLLGVAGTPEATAMLRAFYAVQKPDNAVPSGTVDRPQRPGAGEGMPDPAPISPPPPFVPPPPHDVATAPAANTASTTTSVSPFVPPPPPPASIATAVAPSPEARTTVAAVVAANVQLDKRGFPHDARIHSATPSINKSDDCWRGRRGLDNATLEAVEAELRAKGYGTSAPKSTYFSPPAAPLVPAVPPPPPSVPLPPGVVPAPPAVPPAPATTVMVPPPPPIPSGLPSGDGQGAAAPVDLFRALMAKLKGKTSEDGPLRPEILKPVYADFGVAGPQDFYKKRDQIPAFLARVDQILLGV